MNNFTLKENNKIFMWSNSVWYISIFIIFSPFPLCHLIVKLRFLKKRGLTCKVSRFFYIHMYSSSFEVVILILHIFSLKIYTESFIGNNSPQIYAEYTIFFRNEPTDWIFHMESGHISSKISYLLFVHVLKVLQCFARSDC